MGTRSSSNLDSALLSYQDRVSQDVAYGLLRIHLLRG
jgi:hypothetical protein